MILCPHYVKVKHTINANTRSNSNAQSISLSDIKSLIEESTSKILRTVNSDVESVRKEVKSLKDTLSSLVEKIEAVDCRTKLLDGKVAVLENEVLSLKTKQFFTGIPEEELITEMEERANRRKYLIVSGLEEKESGTVDERRVSDSEAIKRISMVMGIDNFDPQEVHRIGHIRGFNKPRLLRFKCRDMEKKRAFLRQAKTLRHSPNFRGVFIHPDRTKKQRNKETELRHELKRRRNDGEQVVIRRGRIVNPDLDQGFP